MTYDWGVPQPYIFPATSAERTFLEDLLDQTPESRRELGLAGRERIVHEFALERMVERFDTTWTSVLAGESLPRHRGNEPETISINRAA